MSIDVAESCPICGAVNCACNSWINDPEVGVTRGVTFHWEGEPQVDRNRVEDRRMYRSQGRYYVNASRDKIVPEDSSEAAYLFATPGAMMPLSQAIEFGICDKDGNPKDPLTGKREMEDQVVEDKMVRGPAPANPDQPEKKIEKLEQVKGLGKATAEALAGHGITSPDELMAASTDDLVALEIANLTDGKIEDFKRQIDAANASQSDEDDSGDAEGDDDE